MNWYPIFYREILIYQRRLLKLGYVASAIFTPLLYLLAFGLGLGKRVTMPGISYLDYLLPGLIAMSSLTNAYTWVANGLTMGRHYYRTFQVYVQAPIRAVDIVLGEVMAGIMRGLFSAVIILVLGLLLGSRLQLNPLFFLALLLNCALFATFGVIVGLVSKSEHDTLTFNNFFIVPMVFFCGTFFPLDQIPWGVRMLIRSLPLTHTNHLLRYPAMNLESMVSLMILVGYFSLCLIWGIVLVRRYNE